MNIGIIGATGEVGKTVLTILKKNNRYKNIYLSASKTTSIKNKNILRIEELLEKDLQIVIFAAGSEVALKWAPVFAKKNIKVIDNSSAWRMSKNVKLVVPEVNADILKKDDFIIANPNCSTIQLVMILHPLQLNFGLKRVLVSTYQSVSGSGKDALNQLEKESKNEEIKKYYPHKIHDNIIPHIDVFLDNGYTKEEIKIINETKKILSNKKLLISATAVRVPITKCHSESVMVELQNDSTKNEILKILQKSEGVIVANNDKLNNYPMPILASDKDDVFVGRIREDVNFKNVFHLWVVSDNLRKGAATNTVQIADYLIDNNLIF